jgi:hypothetical protein
MLSYVKPFPEWLRSDTVNETIQVLPERSEQLHHVILTISHLVKDPFSQIEKLRVIGTYVSLPGAKAAAHRALFDAGYESEMFEVYQTEHNLSVDDHHKRMLRGVLVHAEAQDGTKFEVQILTTPNNLEKMTVSDSGRILQNLYYVMQTNVSYEDEDDGSEREHNIEGIFLTYEDASERARQVLLDARDGLTKESYAQYDEAAPGETDCGYGENMLVHAVGASGENILISVILCQVLESERLAEAAMRIR